MILPSLLMGIPCLLLLPYTRGELNNTQGELCSQQVEMMREWIKAEMRDDIQIEVERKVKDKLEDMERKIERLTTAVAITVYKGLWDTQNATINYDSFLTLSSSSQQPGGGLSLTTGVFNCTIPGDYSITVSGMVRLDPGEQAGVALHKNGKKVQASQFYSYSQSRARGGWIAEQGSRTVVREILYCTVLYNTLLYCTLLYYTLPIQYCVSCCISADPPPGSRRHPGTQDL